MRGWQRERARKVRRKILERFLKIFLKKLSFKKKTGNHARKMKSRKFFLRRTSSGRLGTKQRPWAKARNLFISYRWKRPRVQKRTSKLYKTRPKCFFCFQANYLRFWYWQIYHYVNAHVLKIPNVVFLGCGSFQSGVIAAQNFGFVSKIINLYEKRHNIEFLITARNQHVANLIGYTLITCLLSWRLIGSQNFCEIWRNFDSQ